jgi:hypothetical protein
MILDIIRALLLAVQYPSGSFWEQVAKAGDQRVDVADNDVVTLTRWIGVSIIAPGS